MIVEGKKCEIEGFGNITSLPKRPPSVGSKGKQAIWGLLTREITGITKKHCGNMSLFTESGSNGIGPRNLWS